MTTKVNQAAELESRIRTANFAYRIGEPIMQDKEYDALLKELKEINPEAKFFSGIEDTFPKDGRAEKLPVDMKSLDKIKEFSDLQKWIQKFVGEGSVVITPKYDGLSLLISDGGEAWTRGGDDNVGMRSDIHLERILGGNVSYASLTRNGKRNYYTGGEVIFPRQDWECKIKGKTSASGTVYKTSRGAICGMMREDNPSSLLKHASFVSYSTPDFTDWDTTKQMYQHLIDKKSSDLVFEELRASEITMELLSDLYHEWSKDYDIDGLVITINNRKLCNKLGVNNVGNPNYAIAFKGGWERRETTIVKGVTCEISKQGLLKPTVQLEGVIIDGAEISNPTGYNMSWIYDNEIGEGAEIEIIRSGEVIPKITKVISPATKEVMQEMADHFAVCPSCGKPTAWNKTYKELVCTNKKCRGRIASEILAFFKVLDFEDVGPQSITKIVEGNHWILSAYDFVQYIIQEEENGVTTSFITSMRKQISKRVEDGVLLSKMLHASGLFNGLGSTKIRAIILNIVNSDHKWYTIGNLMNDGNIDKKVILSTKGIGESACDCFINGFKTYFEDMDDPRGNNLEIFPYIVDEEEKVEIVSGGKYEDEVVCVSGFRDADMEKTIISQGGTISKTVTKKTTLLIVADKNATTSKITKAKQNGVRIINKEEF